MRPIFRSIGDVDNGKDESTPTGRSDKASFQRSWRCKPTGRAGGEGNSCSERAPGESAEENISKFIGAQRDDL